MNIYVYLHKCILKLWAENGLLKDIPVKFVYWEQDVFYWENVQLEDIFQGMAINTTGWKLEILVMHWKDSGINGCGSQYVWGIFRVQVLGGANQEEKG